MTPARRHSQVRLARPYLITEGRTLSARHDLDLTTLVQAGTSAAHVNGPERAQIARLCGRGALSIAELSSRVNLPTSITKILVADLIDTGHLSTRTPSAGAARPSEQLLQEILDGLNAL